MVIKDMVDQSSYFALHLPMLEFVGFIILHQAIIDNNMHCVIYIPPLYDPSKQQSMEFCKCMCHNVILSATN